MVFSFSVWQIDLLITGVIGVYLIYIYLTSTHDYWKKRGVKISKKPLPLFGSMFHLFTFKESIRDLLNEAYRKNKGEYCIGIWIFMKPALVVLNTELIKSILVKDFNNFHDRVGGSCPKTDRIGSSNLFLMRNPVWKSLRIKLTPLFSSSKMRLMFDLINKIGLDLKDYVSDEVKNNDEGVIQTRETCAKFATDSIASVAFGVEAGCFKDPNAFFRKLGRKIFDFTWSRATEIACIFFIPEVARMLRFKVFSSNCTDAMRKVFWDVLKEREKNPIERHDLINTLIKLKNEHNDDDLKFEGDVLLGQAGVFFVAGFETTSSTMCYTLYELMMHPEIQDKVYNEIDGVVKKHNGEITYDAIQELNYLEMCINETLRIYPPLPFLDRLCKQNIKISDNLTVEAGTFIYIPIRALQMDPDYFPDPERFDPERFSPENIEKIKPFTYMPFGEGPRQCIGKRFSYLQLKVGLVYFIKHFEVMRSKNTPKKLVYDPKTILTTLLQDLELKFKPRIIAN